jgi:L-ascorbate metabolism protein UlaG (beta-lactamase superfamily)
MWLRRLGIAFGLVLLGCAGLAIYFLGTYEDAPVDPAWAAKGSDVIPSGAVRVRYTGTATLVISDGDTTLIVDGWFSRPGPLSLFLGEIAPDLAAIETGLARNEVTQAAAVLPVHSHYDHAMDAPEVAKRTGALLLGSEATANIGRGWGLPEEQIRVVNDRDVLRFGRFTLIVIESRHFEFPDPEVRARALEDPEIPAPLMPPVGAFEYRLGKAYALQVIHPRGTLLVQGSAGYVEGGFEGVSADVVFLGIGGLGSQTPEYREAYWRETVERTKPSRVIPIHWDSLMGPIEGRFRGPVRIAGFLAEGTDSTLAFLKEKQSRHPEIQFTTLPRYEPVVLF